MRHGGMVCGRTIDVAERTSRDTGLHRLNKACVLIVPQPANRLDQMLSGEDVCIDIDQYVAGDGREIDGSYSRQR